MHHFCFDIILIHAGKCIVIHADVPNHGFENGFSIKNVKHIANHNQDTRSRH